MVGVGVALAAYGATALWISKAPQAASGDPCNLGLCDPEMEQQAAHLLDLSGAADSQQVLSSYKLLLREDPGSPFNWAKLAFAFLSADDRPHADLCIKEADRLGRGSAPLLMQLLNYDMEVGAFPQVLDVGKRLVSLTTSYDPFVFQYYEQAGYSTADILASGLPVDAPSARDYLGFAIARRNQNAAELTWVWMQQHRLEDRISLNEYTAYLIGIRAYSTAWGAWSNVLGQDSGDNLIFNANFSHPMGGGPFDWSFRDDSDAQISLDHSVAVRGKPSIRIEFSGKSNLSFNHVSHLIYTRGGTLQLTGWVKSSGLTTDQGVFLRISDKDNPARFHLETAPIRERSDWTRIQSSFAPPASTHLLQLEIVRQPSGKIDNKIAGVVWFCDLGVGS